MALLALNASHSTASSTHHLAARAVELHGSGRVVDLATLDPAGLLGTGDDEGVTSLLEEISRSDALVLVTPIYRATYSGLLKVVFDQLRPESLRGVPCVLAATAASPAHFLALDTGFRSLVASLGGWSVPTVVYVTPADLDADRRPLAPVDAALSAALSEVELVRGSGLPH
jgi:FMN reductase